MRFVIFLTLFYTLLTPLTLHSQSYNEKDKDGLRQFLRQPSSISGKANFECLGLSVGDTVTWHSTEAWVNKIQEPASLVYIDWEWDNQTPANLIRLEFKSFDESNTNLSGIFNCSNFLELKELNCSNSAIKGLDLSGSHNLEILDCSNNQIASINTEYCGMLNVLNCAENKLTQLDLALNFNLFDLNCSNNQISQLDITKNKKIRALSCSGNNISNLDLTQTNAIKTLDVSSNNLSHVNLLKQDSLKILSISDNNIETLNITDNKELISLYSSNNKLKGLDISNNQDLVFINVSKNQLTELNTGSNSVLEYLYLPHNNIESINTANNVKLIALNSSNNELSELALTSNPLIEYLDFSFNNIASISPSSTSNIHSFVANDNSLRFSNIPLQYINSATQKLAYAPQAEIDGGEIDFLNSIDLSKEYIFNSIVTNYSWIDENGAPVSMTVEPNGIFKATINEEKVIFCDLTNSAFPLLTLKYKIKVLKNDTTGIENQKDDSSLIVYLDKNSGFLHIISTEAIQKVELFDALGRMVLQEQQSENEISIPVKDIVRNNGVYIVRVKTTSDKISTKKINL